MRAVVLVAAAVAGATPAAASMQTEYDTAQAALDAGKYQDARDRFAALLAKLPKAQAHTAALLAARTGIAERRLGNPVAAIARLTAALAALDPAKDAAERINTGYELGLAYENNGDLAAAGTTYAAVTGESGFAADSLSTGVRLGLIRSKIFTDTAAARRDLDALIAQLPATVRSDKASLAHVYQLRGRIELIDHRYAEARAWFEKALPLSGGLSDRVTVLGQQVRGDLAIASFLGGRTEDAHRYLAFTGTGYLPLASLRFGDTLRPPPCAPLSTLKPDDVAVIEISIADSGRVARATTVYVSHTGGPETLFTDAAREWKWDRGAIAKMPAFYRQALRLEVRCATQRDDDGIGIGLFRSAIEQWQAATRIEPLPDLPDDPKAAEAALTAEIARRTAAFGPDSPQLFPLLFEGLKVLSKDQARVAAPRLAILAEAGGAPADVVLALRAETAAPSTETPAAYSRRVREWSDTVGRAVATTVAEGQGDSRGVAYLRLVFARYAEREKDDARAAAALRAVIAAPPTTVPSADPIRVAALLQLASIEAAHERIADATALYRATGLDAEQCALVDVKPVVRQQSVNQTDFPTEALKWGFDGAVRVGYDIDTTGKPVNVRTITAVPPFVFDAGTERAAAGFRYRPIFRDTAGIGCSGYTSNVKYQIDGVSK
ncbi:MAG: energy transducer TonB [Sphingomonadaceae bacterium]|nr:energy transducer TonB [Sphingomonadaceae bacterium]